MKKVQQSPNSCSERVNSIGYTQVVDYQDFDGLNPDVSWDQASYEYITLPTKKQFVVAHKLGPFVVAAEKSRKMTLFKVAEKDFDQEGQVTATAVCTYAKLNDLLSAATVLDGYLLTAGSKGSVNLFAIPNNAHANKNLKPLKSYHEHQCSVVACDMVIGPKENVVDEFVTADSQGVVKYWKANSDISIWTVDLKERIVDLRTTPSTKIVVASIPSGGFSVHITVLDQGKSVFDRRCDYDPKMFEFCHADELKLRGINHLVGFDVRKHKIGIIELSDEQKNESKAITPGFELNKVITEPKKCLKFFSRDLFFCVLQKRKKDSQLTVCKNAADESAIEFRSIS